MSQFFDYTGVVEEVGQTQSFGASGFTKRELIVGNDIDSNSRYPNPVKFTFKKDNCSLTTSPSTAAAGTARAARSTSST